MLARINVKTNVGFFLVLLGVVVLAFIEGSALSKMINRSDSIYPGEAQLIAFILITIFMISISTLKPSKMILVSYSSMTLGLIVIITGLFDPANKLPLTIKITEIIMGTILIIAGFVMGIGLKLNKIEQGIVKEGITRYKKL